MRSHAESVLVLYLLVLSRELNGTRPDGRIEIRWEMDTLVVFVAAIWIMKGGLVQVVHGTRFRASDSNNRVCD